MADPEALRIAYQTGRVNDTSKGMAMVPIIDVRPYTEGTGDVHDTVNSHITRARSSRPTARPPIRCCTPTSRARRFSACSEANLDEMEQWVASIAKDTAPAKNQLAKVIRNRPAGVSDACYTKDGEKITDMPRCAQMFPVYSNPRLNAGLPMGADDAEMRAEERSTGRTIAKPLTDEQLAALRSAFPSGVCDFSKKGVSVRAPDTWLSFGDELKSQTPNAKPQSPTF